MSVAEYTYDGLRFGALLGGGAGLVLGLQSHPATAVVAAVEIAVPAAGTGALLGLLIGLVSSPFGKEDDEQDDEDPQLTGD